MGHGGLDIQVMGHGGLDIQRFRAWVLGGLADNETRGILAEWLVGQALGAIGDGDIRQGWDAYDLLHGEVKVEVKASGLSQSWNPDERSNPRFDVAPRKWTWLASEDEWIENDPPARPADVYVFCLPEPVPATNENVVDPTAWKFWVLSTRTLDDQLGPQKSVGIATLNRLVAPIGWDEIKNAVDRCADEGSK